MTAPIVVRRALPVVHVLCVVWLIHRPSWLHDRQYRLLVSTGPQIALGSRSLFALGELQLCFMGPCLTIPAKRFLLGDSCWRTAVLWSMVPVTRAKATATNLHFSSNKPSTDYPSTRIIVASEHRTLVTRHMFQESTSLKAPAEWWAQLETILTVCSLMRCY